jgi:hypothetical protein
VSGQVEPCPVDAEVASEPGDVADATGSMDLPCDLVSVVLDLVGVPTHDL